MGKTEQKKFVILNNLQIKNKLEYLLSYDHSKYKNLIIPIVEKENPFERLPFSDFKVSIAAELLDHEALQENLNKLLTFKYQELEYKQKQKEYQEYLRRMEEINNRKKIVELDKEAVKELKEEKPVIKEIKRIEPAKIVKKKRPSRSKVLVVDTLAIIAKIKADSIEKNKGKKVIGRRAINKMLDPFGTKAKMRRDIGVAMDDKNILTSIDIYLNAVDKIKTDNILNNENLNRNRSVGNTQELSINDILKDIDKK